MIISLIRGSDGKIERIDRNKILDIVDVDFESDTNPGLFEDIVANYNMYRIEGKKLQKNGVDVMINSPHEDVKGLLQSVTDPAAKALFKRILKELENVREVGVR